METDKQLVEAVLKSSKSGRGPDSRKRLTCAEAFTLAKEYRVEIIKIGRICNQNNIKICKCQLGCFT
jgi:hypothetical protein